MFTWLKSTLWLSLCFYDARSHLKTRRTFFSNICFDLNHMSLWRRNKLMSLWHWSKLRSLWHWPKWRSLWSKLFKHVSMPGTSACFNKTKWQRGELIMASFRAFSLLNYDEIIIMLWRVWTSLARRFWWLSDRNWLVICTFKLNWP